MHRRHWRILEEANRDPQAYTDAALIPVQDDVEETTYDYLTKTDGAKAAIEHLKKVAELTHKPSSVVTAPSPPS